MYILTCNYFCLAFGDLTENINIQPLISQNFHHNFDFVFLFFVIVFSMYAYTLVTLITLGKSYDIKILYVFRVQYNAFKRLVISYHTPIRHIF